MASFSLHDRLVNQGTLSEEDGIPNPQFALPSTVNWMRALAILVKGKNFTYEQASLSARWKKAKMSPHQENSVFEHLLLAVHQLAAMRAMQKLGVQSDIARVAIVGWYYGIYAAAAAMIAAQEGVIHDNHTKTANAWGRQFAQCGLVPHPFSLRVSTLVKKNADAEIDCFRHGPKENLVKKPVTVEDAHQALCAYLSGTRGRCAERIEKNIKSSKAFKDLGVKNFRTTEARKLRDDCLRKHSISFMHQAFRFRGKANYREALYLAHGKHVEATLSEFVSDMTDVLEAFVAMAGAFAFKRLGNDLRDGFLEDLDRHRSFSLDHRDVWC